MQFARQEIKTRYFLRRKAGREWIKPEESEIWIKLNYLKSVQHKTYMKSVIWIPRNQE